MGAEFGHSSSFSEKKKEEGRLINKWTVIESLQKLNFNFSISPPSDSPKLFVSFHLGKEKKVHEKEIKEKTRIIEIIFVKKRVPIQTRRARRGEKLARRISRRILRFSTKRLPDQAFVSKLNPYPRQTFTPKPTCKFARDSALWNADHQNRRFVPVFQTDLPPLFQRGRVPEFRCPLGHLLFAILSFFVRSFRFVCDEQRRDYAIALDHWWKIEIRSGFWVSVIWYREESKY